MPFAGLRVLSLESRRAKEMDTLIRREGGDPFVAPSVQERALEDHGDAIRFVERLEAGEFDMLICMTGTGLAFFRDRVAAYAAMDRLGAALRRVAIVSRGPKPLPILRELGARADIVVPEPNTWREIVDAVAPRPERRIVVQEYGRPNPEMNAALEQLGANVTPMVVYRWELPDDLEPLRAAAHRLAGRQFDVILFTSSIQLDHLMKVAGDLGVQLQVSNALREYTAIASVGPVMTASLEAAGLPADIAPVHPKMAALVKAASDTASAVLAQKRAILTVQSKSV
ncbi:MAG TPA: uroporphyrinogen-III synthase [Bryobacteraceae bacterium]|nr:uroporphyrinogen-III synthase [Bryobacteraceae bacterium]